MQKSTDLKNLYHAYRDFQNFVQIAKHEKSPSVKMSDDGDSYYVEAPDREPFQDVTYKVNIVEPPMPNIRNVFSSAPPKKMNKKHLSEGQSLKLSERSLNHSMGSMNSSDRQMEQK